MNTTGGVEHTVSIRQQLTSRTKIDSNRCMFFFRSITTLQNWCSSEECQGTLLLTYNYQNNYPLHYSFVSEIINAGNNDKIAIGLVSEYNVERGAPPGWCDNSAGYHLNKAG